MVEHGTCVAVYEQVMPILDRKPPGVRVRGVCIFMVGRNGEEDLSNWWWQREVALGTHASTNINTPEGRTEPNVLLSCVAHVGYSLNAHNTQRGAIAKVSQVEGFDGLCLA